MRCRPTCTNRSTTARKRPAAERRRPAPDAGAEETASILKYAAVCHEQSGGLFDITSGVFRHVWHPQRTTLPSQQELDACAAKVGWDKVQFSEREVFLPLPGMELDFGGVVKEYAADATAMVAGKAGIRHGLVNLGGDIRIVGPRGGRSAVADWNRPSTAPGPSVLSGYDYGAPDRWGEFATETGPRAPRPDDERPRHPRACTDWWSTGPGGTWCGPCRSGSWC